ARRLQKGPLHPHGRQCDRESRRSRGATDRRRVSIHRRASATTRPPRATNPTRRPARPKVQRLPPASWIPFAPRLRRPWPPHRGALVFEESRRDGNATTILWGAPRKDSRAATVRSAIDLLRPPPDIVAAPRRRSVC